MNARLLLLLVALVGPFCGFTHASPTAVPGDGLGSDGSQTEETNTEVSKDETTPAAHDYLTLYTGPPPTDPTAAPLDVRTEAVTEAITHPLYAVTYGFRANTEVATDAATAAATPPSTDPPAEQTNTPAEQTEDFLVRLTTEAELKSEWTEAPEVQTEATAAPEVQAQVTEAPEVMIEEETNGSLSSGQVVGIVIGALLAVVIAIVVVIGLVRRMRKYTSARSKKPVKKDSVMTSPLKKKNSKQQQQNPKFWKF